MSLLSHCENEKEMRYVQAYLEAGSSRKAALILGCHHATVSTYIQRIKNRMENPVEEGPEPEESNDLDWAITHTANNPSSSVGFNPDEFAEAFEREPREHLFIPDTQLKPGVDFDHIIAAANYANHKQPDVIVIAGDWWDLPSLSSYEKPGSKHFEGKRLKDDIEFPNRVMRKFEETLDYRPEVHFLEGNHEYRMQRVIDEDPVRYEGVLGRHLFYIPDWFEFHDFREIVDIDGISYSHYFQNPESLTKNILSGQMPNRLNKLKRSFTMGHQQTLLTGEAYIGDRRIRGCVAGAFYQHQEAYMGPQGNAHWRGMIYKHEVHDGDYDLLELSMNYLLRKWL